MPATRGGRGARLVPLPEHSDACGLTQRIITIVVQSLDFVAVEALVSDLQKKHRGNGAPATPRWHNGLPQPLLRSDGISHGGSLCALTETVQPVRCSRRTCLDSK